MELRKSTLLLSLVVAGGLFCSTASYADFSPADIKNFVMSKIPPLLDKLGSATSKKTICQRGYFPGTISIRSLEGKICGSNEVIGAVAKVVCDGYEGKDVKGKDDKFKGSQCDQKGGFASVGDAQSYLKKQLIKKNADAKTLLCSQKFSDGNPFAEIAKSCPKK